MMTVILLFELALVISAIMYFHIYILEVSTLGIILLSLSIPIVIIVAYTLYIAIENRIFDREFDKLQKEQNAERGTFEEELARIEASKKNSEECRNGKIEI